MAVHPAKTRISLGIHPFWSESSLSALTIIGSLATHKMQAKTPIRLGRCPGWSESSLGAQIILLVFLWGGSNDVCLEKTQPAHKKCAKSFLGKLGSQGTKLLHAGWSKSSLAHMQFFEFCYAPELFIYLHSMKDSFTFNQLKYQTVHTFIDISATSLYQNHLYAKNHILNIFTAILTNKHGVMENL